MNKSIYTRLLGYTFEHKGLFFLSIIGFILFNNNAIRIDNVAQIITITISIIRATSRKHSPIRIDNTTSIHNSLLIIDTTSK